MNRTQTSLAAGGYNGPGETSNPYTASKTNWTENNVGNPAAKILLRASNSRRVVDIAAPRGVLEVENKVAVVACDRFPEFNLANSRE